MRISRIVAIGIVLAASQLVSATHASDPVPTWSELVLPAPNPERTTVYDPVGDRLVVLDTVLEDCWTFSFGAAPEWSRLQFQGTKPGSIRGAAAVWDSRRNRILVVSLDWRALPYPDVVEVWALELGQVNSWTQLATTGTPPFWRCAEGLVYDRIRDRLLIHGGWLPGSSPEPWFQGDPFGDLWQLPLENGDVPLAWSEILPTGTTPEARGAHALVLDTVRDRLVLWGGFSPMMDEAFGDAWVLPLIGAPQWTPLPRVVEYPYPTTYRAHSAAVFDSLRNRMVVYGGLAPVIHGVHIDPEAAELSFGTTSDPDTTAVWRRLTSGIPGPRHSHGGVLRTATNQLAIFGGFSSDRSYRFHGNRSDLWTLDLSGAPIWTGFAEGPPAERAGESLVYDSVRDQLILFGGWNADYVCDPIVECDSEYNSDTWSLRLGVVNEWELREITPELGTRSGHCAVVDPVRDRMLVFGGDRRVYSPSREYMNDLWSIPLDPAGGWTQLAPTNPPPERTGASLIHDPVEDRFLLFGGGGPAGSFNDVWQLSGSDPTAWTLVVPGGTPPPASPTRPAFYDSEWHRMLVLGPWNENRLWQLSLGDDAAWSEMTVVGSLPNIQWESVAIYDPIGRRIVVVGLSDQLKAWALDLTESTGSWSPLAIEGPVPEPAWEYSAAYDSRRDRMIVHGLYGYPASNTYVLPVGNRTFALNFNRVVATGVSSYSVRAEPGQVTISWWLSEGHALVQRRDAFSEWKEIGESSPDASGIATFVDRDVSAGMRYGYRLRTSTGVGGETWVEVPAEALALRMLGAQPNPAPDLRLSFELPNDGPVRLALFDSRGRVVIMKEIAPGRGRHLVSVPEANALAPGLYFVHLRQGMDESVARVSIVR